MASYSKTILIGNMTKDPELKVTPGGQPICKFGVCTNESWKDKDGNKKEKATFHNIVVFGKQAEIAEKYLKKGKQVMIEGKIQNDDYTDKDGVKKSFSSIRCDNFVMLGGNRDEAPRGGPVKSYDNDDFSSGKKSDGYDDDIPF